MASSPCAGSTRDAIYSFWCSPINEYALLSAVPLVTLAIVACFTWTCASKKAMPPLPPGPRGFPLVGYLPYLRPDIHRVFEDLAHTYGPIIKVQIGGKLWIVVSSPLLAEQVLREQDTTFANRDLPAAANVLTYGGADIACNHYGPEWRMLRKVATQELLSHTALDLAYSLRRCVVRRMVRDVYENIIKVGAPVNIRNEAIATTLDIAMSMAWGGTIEVGGEGKRRSPGSLFRPVFDEITEMLNTPDVSDLFPVVAWFDLQGVVRRARTLLAQFDQMFESAIDQRMGLHGVGGEGKSKDFLQLLLLLEEAGDPKMPLTMTHVKALLIDIVTGATDTTSTTIEWAMTEMMHHPEMMRKAQEELNQVVGKDQIVEESHLPRLRYLDVFVKEVLRLHSTPFLMPRRASEPCTVGGYMVPTRARVIVNTWAIHRDPGAWDDPLAFPPERFFPTTTKLDSKGNSDFRYLPFGSGRRRCAGISMGERVVIYVLASLLHSFDWNLPEGTMKVDLLEKFGVILKKATPLIAVPTPRLSKNELYF